MDEDQITPTRSATGRQLLAFMFGAAIGATVAAMYAPASGATTRARIFEGANQAKDAAGQYVDQATELATDLKDKTVAAVHGTLARAAGALQHASDFTDPGKAITRPASV